MRLLGSGTAAAVGTIAMPVGSFKSEIRAGFTVAPEVVYAPIRARASVRDQDFIRARRAAGKE